MSQNAKKSKGYSKEDGSAVTSGWLENRDHTEVKAAPDHRGIIIFTFTHKSEPRGHNMEVGDVLGVWDSLYLFARSQGVK